MPAIHCIDKFYYEWRVIQSIQTRWTTKWANETPWGRAAWLEMNNRFCWPSAFVRFVLVCWSQAGHLHSRLAHKSCLMAEWTDSASILALFHMVPSISTLQHNQVSPPVSLTDWTEGRRKPRTILQGQPLAETDPILTQFSGEEGIRFPLDGWLSLKTSV